MRHSSSLGLVVFLATLIGLAVLTGPKAAAQNYQWQAFSGPYKEPKNLGSSGYHWDSYRLGLFDGDNKTDVLIKDGNQFRLSSGAVGDWKNFGSSGYSMGSFHFADFNGDGQLDLFMQAQNQWRVSYASPEGFGNWVNLGTTGYAAWEINVADVSGDGRADIVVKSGGAWYYSDNGMSDWNRLTDSQIRASSLKFADIVGDDRADALAKFNHSWWVSDAARGEWKRLFSTAYKIIAFGDFNGDQKSDILVRVSNSLYIYHSNSRSTPKKLTLEAHCGYVDAGDFIGNGVDQIFRIQKACPQRVRQRTTPRDRRTVRQVWYRAIIDVRCYSSVYRTHITIRSQSGLKKSCALAKEEVREAAGEACQSRNRNWTERRSQRRYIDALNCKW